MKQHSPIPGASLTPTALGAKSALMKVGIISLAWLKRLLAKVRELLNRPTDVRYTNVPFWRPWRDF
jgi:hypothetical protein